MREKYSTDELVNALMGTTICNDVTDAIIARLRAADKLCEAASGNIDDIYGRAKLGKAIAEYGAKEKT